MKSLPRAQLSPLANVVVNVAAWALFHAVTGYAAHRIPARRLQRDSWLLRPRPFERNGHLYERFWIRRWKDVVPEAGAIFPGGVSKRHLSDGSPQGLERFAVETRRAELGHWSALSCGPAFALWNPPAIAVVMVAYGVLVNAPFIAIQRYNRLRIGRALARRSRSTSRFEAR